MQRGGAAVQDLAEKQSRRIARTARGRIAAGAGVVCERRGQADRIYRISCPDFRSSPNLDASPSTWR